MGATGGQDCRPFLQHHWYNLGGCEVIYKVLYLPDCLVALMGQDILRKLQTQITFDTHGQASLNLGMPEARIMSLTVPQGEE